MSRAPMISRIALAVSASLALPTLFACIQHPLKPVVLKQEAEGENQIALVINRDVDVLFVIDNSGSMGEEQGGLSKAFPDFIKVLDRVKANYHIGITTSDMKHWDSSCSGTDALEGHLRMELCTERENEFYFAGSDTYRFNNACKSVCPITADGESEEDYELLPTATLEDPDEKVRPWIQNIEGKTNIAKASAEDALACYGPQGINGCGFESQLEAMTQALDYSKKQNEEEYGFLRDRAILAVVHVTDELDCSSNPNFQAEVWDNENETFWSDTATQPNSSICWNAGVKCTGMDGGAFEDCQPQDYAPNGDEISEEEADEHKSVLLSLNRYIGQLDSLEKRKKEIDINQELVFAVIGGVNSRGEASYPIGKGGNGADAESYRNFGIGRGCHAPVSVLAEEDFDGNPIPAEMITQAAVPPVRLKKIAEHFGDEENQSMFSVCDPTEYGEALEVIAKKIEEQIRPACYRNCPENQDPDADLFKPKCQVTETSKQHGTVVLNECARTGEGDDKVYLWEDDNYVIENDDEDSCYAMLVDKDGSSDTPHDDLSQECIDEHRVLEFKVARRPGVTMPADLLTQANCSLSSFKDIDCPEPDDI